MPPAERIDSILLRALKQHGVGERLKEFEVVAKFAEIVGSEISSHATATGIRRGKLYLKVESSIWRQELVYQKRDIIEKLNRALETQVVKDIFFSG